MKFYVQLKTWSDWETRSTTNNEKVAFQRCLQLMKQYRGKNGYEYAKSRVAILVNGEFVRFNRS